MADVQDILETVMTERGWTSTDVASRLGVHQETVDRWRRGERNPGDMRFARSLVTLGVDPTKYGLPAIELGSTISAPTQLDKIESMLRAIVAFLRDDDRDALDGITT